jgi:hypothetical protein
MAGLAAGAANALADAPGRRDLVVTQFRELAVYPAAFLEQRLYGLLF